ncbi:hypothetical protein MC28_G116 (plasmid) [Bacillus thuringiensis MC28]|nr:hypothetical protein MC28_G116 [Bacillus thuringiensis MC28]
MNQSYNAISPGRNSRSKVKKNSWWMFWKGISFLINTNKRGLMRSLLL